MIAGYCSPSLAWRIACLVVLCCSWEAVLSFGNHALFKGTASARGTTARSSTAATTAAATVRPSRGARGHAGRGLDAHPRRHSWAYGREMLGSSRVMGATAGESAESGGDEDAGQGNGVTTGFDNSLVLERPIDRVVLPEGRGLRVHCMSDLHTDVKGNMAW